MTKANEHLSTASIGTDLEVRAAEYAQIVREVEKARVALNATRWWQFVKRDDAARRYKAALWIGAMWELRTHPGQESDR